jgi:hypothetical protein
MTDFTCAERLDAAAANTVPTDDGNTRITPDGTFEPTALWEAHMKYEEEGED